VLIIPHLDSVANATADLPAGTIAYFLSFNHDTEKFEIIASGHVTDDSGTIITDPGAGLTISGWGCNCPPYSITGKCRKCTTTCLNSGSLFSSGNASVNNAKPSLGDTIVFTFNGTARDTGGKKQVVCVDENGTLEGDVSIEYTGHLAVERKALNDDDSPEQREENLKAAVKNRLSTAEFTNIVIENVTDPAKPFIYRYHVRVPEYAQRTGKRLFLQPAFFQKGIPALFATSTRRYPIYFHFPWSEEDKVTFSLPKGYALDNADSPAPFTAGAVSHYEVKMGVTKDQSTLIYDRKFFFGGNGTILFPADRYSAIKQLFDVLNTADNHTITLKQAASTASN